MNVVHVDDLERIELDDGFVWRPVRRHFDIRAFGVNAYTAREAGGQIVEEHSEGVLGHEEIYLVLRGRARFTVDGNEHELGAGQLVFVSDPALQRGAVAIDADTVVLAVGGKPGVAYTVSAWETMFAAVPLINAGRWEEAIATPSGGARRASPTIPRCSTTSRAWKRRGGRHLDALLHLQRAVELEPRWAGQAQRDKDFTAIRGEPGFPA